MDVWLGSKKKNEGNKTVWRNDRRMLNAKKKKPFKTRDGF